MPPTKATTGSETTPKAHAHIRVGPPFESTIDRTCGCGCGASTLGKRAAIVENTVTKKKRAYLESCLATRPDLLARRATESEEDFLAA